MLHIKYYHYYKLSIYVQYTYDTNDVITVYFVRHENYIRIKSSCLSQRRDFNCLIFLDQRKLKQII